MTNVTGLTPPVTNPSDDSSSTTLGSTLGDLIGWALLGAAGFVFILGLLACMCI